MTDAEYLLRQDIREKKSAARSARARVSGSKSKYCGLPSDKLTAAQLKRRNGPVHTYNVTTHLSYKEFKKLPDDLKLQYLSDLTHTYRVPMKAVAAAMGCGESTLSRCLSDIDFEPPRGRVMPLPGHKWFTFVAGGLDIHGEPVRTNPPTPAEEKTLPAPVPAYPTSGVFTITGTQAELDSYLRLSLPADTVYEFSVHFTRAQGCSG